MAIKLFGYKIGKEEDLPDIKSFVAPKEDAGAVAVSGGGVYGIYTDLEGTVRNDADLIKRYRDMANQPECDAAIEDIVNESLVFDEGNYPVQIILDKLKQPESIKKKVREEYYHIMKLLDFNNQGYDIFRRWYIDGRLYYHMMIDEKNPRHGLKEVRYIDPRKIRKIKEVKRSKPQLTNRPDVPEMNEYFIYSNKGFSNDTNHSIKIATDSICYVHSGITDKDGRMVISHLHKAIKTLNQLRMLEDATVIYRISRAPERRIFYIDVGNLPKMKAEQYLREIMQKYKNKLVYDAQSGEIRDDRRYQTMLEDFWLPRREGGKGTEITTLQGGQNLGEIDDVLYFQKKLYKSLNVPVSRLESDTGFSLGRASEITRDELKFSKFIRRLRLRFSHLFDRLLETQLLLKGICTRAEWNMIKEEISYDFINDMYFSELKQTEILKERIGMLSDVDSYVGKYFSSTWIRKNVLRQTENDIEQIDNEMKEESSDVDNESEIAQIPQQQASFEEHLPQEAIINVKKEEKESIVSDTDQIELAKSMTKFFDTLVEEAKGDKE
jgi:hypothetical protein